MRKLATLIALGLFTLQSSAAVFVYRMNVSWTATGGGQSTKGTTTGFMIYDPSANEVYTVNVLKAWKYYGVQEWSGLQFDQIRAPKNKRLTAITVARNWYDSDDYPRMDTGLATGQNFIVVVGGSTNFVPKTFSYSGTSIYPTPTDDESISEKQTGTMTIDLKETQTVNGFGDSAESAAERLAARYAVLPGYQRRYWE